MGGEKRRTVVEKRGARFGGFASEPRASRAARSYRDVSAAAAASARRTIASTARACSAPMSARRSWSARRASSRRAAALSAAARTISRPARTVFSNFRNLAAARDPAAAAAAALRSLAASNAVTSAACSRRASSTPRLKSNAARSRSSAAPPRSSSRTSNSSRISSWGRVRVVAARYPRRVVTGAGAKNRSAKERRRSAGTDARASISPRSWMGFPARASSRRSTSRSNPAPRRRRTRLSCNHSSRREESRSSPARRSTRFEKSQRRSRRGHPAGGSSVAMALSLRMSSRSWGSSGRPDMDSRRWWESSSLRRVSAAACRRGRTRRPLCVRLRCVSARHDWSASGSSASKASKAISTSEAEDRSASPAASPSSRSESVLGGTSRSSSIRTAARDDVVARRAPSEDGGDGRGEAPGDSCASRV